MFNISSASKVVRAAFTLTVVLSSCDLVRTACLFTFCVVTSASTLKFAHRFAVSNNCLKHGDSVVMYVCALTVRDLFVCFSEV